MPRSVRKNNRHSATPSSSQPNTHAFSLPISSQIQADDVNWWLKVLTESNIFDAMSETVQTALKVSFQTLSAFQVNDQAFQPVAETIVAVTRHLINHPDIQRHFAEFAATSAITWATAQLKEEMAEAPTRDSLSADEIKARLRTIWANDEFITNALMSCFSAYTQKLASALANEVLGNTALPQLMNQSVEQIIERFREYSPALPSSGTVSQAASAIENDVFTIFSDPHSQAAIRSIWAASNGDFEAWKRPQHSPPFYSDKSDVIVYIADAEPTTALTPVELEAAWKQVLTLDDSQVNTFVICIGKWFADTAGTGSYIISTRIHVNDILAFRGVKKHHKGGYRSEQKQEARRDVLALNRIWVKSTQDVWESHGRSRRKKTVKVESRLIELAIDSEQGSGGEEIPYAFRLRPGEWASPYVGEPNRMTAMLLRPIMAYDPRQGVGRIAMRLGIYLTMQWRIRASHGNYAQPWKIKTLLEGAGLLSEMDVRLHGRFRQQVESALTQLLTDEVISSWKYVEVPKSGLEFKHWIELHVMILPPIVVLHHYGAILPATRRIAASIASSRRKKQDEPDKK